MYFSSVLRNYRSSMMRTPGRLSMRGRTASAFLASLKSGKQSKVQSGSLYGNSSVSRKSTMSTRSDVANISAISSKVSSGLTKAYTDELKAQARSDAQAGVYGKDGKASELRVGQMQKYVSPDREAAIAQASELLSSASPPKMGTTAMKLSGLPYTVAVTKGRNGTTAELFDECGEKFASYDGRTGEWKKTATKAEAQFQTASSSIYDEAYRAAQAGVRGSGRIHSSLDFRA